MELKSFGQCVNVHSALGIVIQYPTTRIPNFCTSCWKLTSPADATRPSQKPPSADISETESGIIDPLVSNPPKNSE